MFLLTIALAISVTSGFNSVSIKQSHRPWVFGQTSLRSEASRDAAVTDSGHLPTIAVVGAGWGGFGAALSLSNYYNADASSPKARIVLIDALPDPTGRTPFLSPTGKPVEPGTRGFWYDYPNINSLVTKILEKKEEEVFTPFTNSSFYSPDGLEITAPIFSEVGPNLPSPFGQVLKTFPLFERLPLKDRASMAGLLVAATDCIGSDDEKRKEEYDKMSAYDLLVKCKCSKRLIDDFIRPTLLVGLFKPPEELSALVTLELLYFYALAHTTSFDVRWIKNGTVASSIFAPLSEKLIEQNCLEVKGGCFVNEISTGGADNSVQAITFTDRATNTQHTINNLAGAVIALGNKGLKSVVKTR